MITFLKNRLRRFGREEKGSGLVIEFVIFVPILMGCFLASVEMSMYAMNQMFLDRGLDVTVRYVRLNTGTPMTHDQLKDKICEEAGFLQQCGDTLRLEMIKADPRNFASFDKDVDCVDTSEEISDPREMQLGGEHELMMLRACVKFKPVFPGTGLGAAFEKDGSGMTKMISIAAFVQEPT